MNNKTTHNYLIISNNYYPFGSVAKGRSFSSQSYRYGFNGKEKDDEVKGDGNSYEYGFRIYDSRLGRFLSVDPLTSSYPWFTPYQFASNKPINSIDLDGLEDFEVHIKPVSSSAKLKQVFVNKVFDHNKTSDPTFGTGGVQYITYDASGNVVSSTRKGDFNANSSEAKYMNSTVSYYNNKNATGPAQSASPKEVMAATEVGADGKLKTEENGKYIGPNKQLVGRISFQFQTNVLFNTDKSDLAESSLQPGTYEDAMTSLAELSSILTGGHIIGTTRSGAPWDFNIGSYKLSINGKTDSRPSKYNGCGNSCLGKDRAQSVLDNLRDSGVTQPATTNNMETTGAVNSDDRKATVDITPN